MSKWGPLGDDVLEISIVYLAVGLPAIAFEQTLSTTEKLLLFLVGYLVLGALVLAAKGLFRKLTARRTEPQP